MAPINTSIFELFKIGPGPSSSHTIGPMKAGYDFLTNIKSLPGDLLEHTERIEVRLFGSLSATGKGHGTDRAILAGLMGQKPETCPSNFLDELLGNDARIYSILLPGRTIEIRKEDIIFDKIEHNYPYSNTLLIRLIGDKSVIFEREYYSVGGGFLQWKGWRELDRGEPSYPYENMAEGKQLLTAHNLRLHEMMLINEESITGMNEEKIYDRLDNIIDVMICAVERGIKTEGVLPGPIGLHRKASILAKRGHREIHIPDRFLVLLNAYALAAAEENAAGHTIVTAPTAGSAGVLPAIIYTMKHHLHMHQQIIREGMLAAALVGFLAKHNASISGAEVGCQGEIGVASSMAAAMLAYTHGYGFKITEDAAEIALEHHLGMTCDPVGGYVQIPCIERNGMGTLKAYNAFLIASDEIPDWHIVDLDRTMRAMMETGRDMSTKYKETSEGGLATCVGLPHC